MYKKVGFAVSLSCVIVASSHSYATPTTVSNNYFKKSYQSFEVVLDCDKNGLAMYKAIVRKDEGNRRRDTADFQLDPTVPASCQQGSTNSYPPGYHRGHLQGANTSENSQAAYEETFYMTNVLPMTKELNIGAWHKTDEIIECLRDRSQPVLVMGGPIWSGPHASGLTLKKHGVSIPSSYWKVIKQGEYQIAWLIPNSKSPHKETLRQWESSVEEIQRQTGFEIPADLELYRNYRPDSWYNTRGCDLK